MKTVMRRIPCSAGYAQNQVMDVQIGRYPNDRLAIQLIDVTGEIVEPWATLTINIPSKPCGPNEVYIKNYSENDGLEEWAKKVGIIAEHVGTAIAGYVLIPRYRLTDSFLALIQDE